MIFRTGLFFTAITSTLSAFSQVTSNLTARFGFDGNSDESLGNAAATLHNCTYTTDRQGNANSAVFIDGTANSYINLGTSSALKPTAGSVSLWVNVHAVNNLGSGFDYNPIILTRNATGRTSYFEGYSLYFKRTDKKLLALTTNPSGNVEKFIWSSQPCTLDSWFHLVMCYNKDSLWFYVNNSLQNRIARGFDQVFASGDSVVMGISRIGSNDRNFTGTVDEVRIYKAVLKPEQVDTLYKLPALLGTGRFETGQIQQLLYPNPANHTVRISPEIAAAHLSIYDAAGRQVFSAVGNGEIPLSLKQGLYTAVISDQAGSSFTQKLMIQTQ